MERIFRYVPFFIKKYLTILCVRFILNVRTEKR
nr:MAG TPA: serine/threonine-protein kinase [Bacteriophage sp.]